MSHEFFVVDPGVLTSFAGCRPDDVVALEAFENVIRSHFVSRASTVTGNEPFGQVHFPVRTVDPALQRFFDGSATDGVAAVVALSAFCDALCSVALSPP